MQKRLKTPEEEYRYFLAKVIEFQQKKSTTENCNVISLFLRIRWIDSMVLNPTSVTFNSDVDKVIVPSAALQQPFFEKEYAL